MKKKILLSLILVALFLTGCKTSSSQSEDDTNKSEPSTDKVAEATQESNDSPKVPFQKNTDEELAGLPESQKCGAAMGNMLNQIGVSKVEAMELGNYMASSVIYQLDGKFTTDTGAELIVNALYTSYGYNPSWDVLSIRDYNNGNYYYVTETLVDYTDLYDYKTGKLISKHTKDIKDVDPDEEYNKRKEEIDKELEKIKEKYSSDEADTSSRSYTLKHGTLVESNPKGGVDGKTLVIKAKIKSNLTNKMTVSQNYFNVADIIHNQGGNEFNCIDYWAVADMTSGSEEKVVAFTISKDVIDMVYANQIADNQIGEYANDLYIHPSLQ